MLLSCMLVSTTSISHLRHAASSPSIVCTAAQSVITPSSPWTTSDGTARSGRHLHTRACALTLTSTAHAACMHAYSLLSSRTYFAHGCLSRSVSYLTSEMFPRRRQALESRMSVHPQAQVLLDLMAQRPRPQPTDLPLDEYRAFIEKIAK